MTLRGPSIWIRTAFFKPEPDEARVMNPGRSGHALARWLSEQLKGTGVPVQSVDPDDWGWRLTLATKPHLVWLACGMRWGSPDEWAVYVVAETSLFQTLFGRVDLKPEVRRLHQLLYPIMQRAPGVTETWLEDEPDWMS
jgi:hypothetical protein